MAKHKAGFFERPAAYIPKQVSAARSKFALAMLDNDRALARTIRVRGRVGSTIREWSDSLGPWWLQPGLTAVVTEVQK